MGGPPLFLHLYLPPSGAIYIFVRKNSIPFELVKLVQGELDWSHRGVAEGPGHVLSLASSLPTRATPLPWVPKGELPGEGGHPQGW